jgi:Protein kinase domain
MTSLPVRIGRYQIRERLAQGGMGVLYLGFDPATDRHVALKVLRVDSTDFRERFLREARLSARLQHPNIITVYDVGSHEGQPFIAMEFVAGETLAQIIGRGAPLPLARIISLAQQICQGLGYAHRHGIVHRDIKPANLMVSRESGVLKVLDFGVAGRVESEGVSTLLMGTPNYMSPEQIVGQAIDQRSDIFSVGLVIYELVSCRQAFSADSQQGVLLKVLHESPLPLETIVADLDRALPRIINRALEKSADQRYPDLDAMRSDLSRIAQRIEIGEAARLASHRKAQRSGGRRRPPGPAGEEARIHDLLAAAERDAYEGRHTAAIRKLEASGVQHADVLAALDRYRSGAAEAARAVSEAEAAEARALTDLVRGQVGGVRAAITAGRWTEAATLIAALEARLPGREGEPSAETDPARDPTPFVLRREEEVAHYLVRARQRLDSGDISSALALVDAALGVTLVARPTSERAPSTGERDERRGEGARDR